MTTIATAVDNNDSPILLPPRSLSRRQSEQSDTSTPLFMESISYDDDNDTDEREELASMKNKNVDDEEVISNQQQSSPPMHHHERDTTPSPTITMIRSRRNNNNNSNTGGDSPGYAEDSSPGGNRFCNLKKKRFRDNIGGIDYEPVETGERGGGVDIGRH